MAEDSTENIGEKTIPPGLKPWKPGQSGNPGGRPKMTPEERERWKALAEKCLDKLEIMIDSGEMRPSEIAKILDIASDRAWGKAIQAVEVSGEDGGPLAVRILKATDAPNA